MAVHLRSAQVDPAADAKLQRRVHQWPERWLTRTAHTRLSWLALHMKVKSLYLVCPIKRLVDVMWVWRVAEGRERASCLSDLYQHPPPSPPSAPSPVWGPSVYFFMNVWIRWKWGSIGFGFGFQGLTCYCTRTHTNSLSLTHTQLHRWIGTINPN